MYDILPELRSGIPCPILVGMRQALEDSEEKRKSKESMKSFVFMLTAPTCMEMLRGIIKPELEKRGLTPLTDEHWQLFLEESEKQLHYLSWREDRDKQRREAAERAIIRDFIREGE